MNNIPVREALQDKGEGVEEGLEENQKALNLIEVVCHLMMKKKKRIDETFRVLIVAPPLMIECFSSLEL